MTQNTGVVSLPFTGFNYQACAASATTACGAAGAVGDVLNSVLVVPGTTSPGDVQIKDGSGRAITVFAGGSTSETTLTPFTIDLKNIKSVAGGWSIVTGANVTAVAVGQFA